MRIQHNIMAMNAYRNYNTNTSALSKNLEKLSSGYKINRAGDDAAGLAISEKMRAQITGLNAAQKNVKDGISLVKTAEGAMQEIQDMLNRMDYLATQSANGTYDDPVDRLNLQKEVEQLRSEINRIADSANFNGIKLLDGSMDATSTTAASPDSAISGITVNEFAAQGVSDAFKATYITNRPEAVKTQTNAEFVVKLDDFNFTGAEKDDEFTLTVGDASITFTAGTTAPTDVEDIVDGLVAAGKDVATANADGSKTAAEITGENDWKNTGNYVEVDGHIYKMTKEGTDSIKFTQCDNMGTNGTVVNPDYHVSIKGASKGANKTLESSGTVNWQNQLTVTGKGVGTSHQAQVNVDIDFSKLKDGDKLIAGNKTYVFKIGDNGTASAGTGETLINLTSILRTQDDLSDTDKLKEAMVKMTKDMGVNTTWSVGNEGVDGTTGKLSFQSLSSYTGDTVPANKQPIGGVTGGDTCDMRTESSVMAQFQSVRAAQPASVSFDLDVTKLKNGDTLTIDGVTFEFTDSATPSTKGNIAVNLSTMGISDEAGSIASYETAKVVNALKTAVNGELNYGGNAKYTITAEGNKVTLTSTDNTNTSVTKENQIAAEIKLPQGAYAGKALTLQIGDTSDSFNQLKVSIGDMHTAALKIDGLSVAKQDDAQAAIQTIKDAINYVSGVRGDLGATQNRLEHTANNLSVMAENIQDAESTIRDTDIAEEMMAYTKNNILVQSAQAMLAQANAVPQGVLQLLG